MKCKPNGSTPLQRSYLPTPIANAYVAAAVRCAACSMAWAKAWNPGRVAPPAQFFFGGRIDRRARVGVAAALFYE